MDTTTKINMPLSVSALYTFIMESKSIIYNDYDNGHAFISFNGGTSVTVADSNYGYKKFFIALGKV